MNDTDLSVDLLADCATCNARIEHYAGVPGSEWLIPFWRHPDDPRPHRAVAAEGSVRDVTR